MLLTLDPDEREFYFVFSFNEDIKNDLKESLPGRQWEGNSTWSVPITPTSIPLVFAFADKWGFKISDEAKHASSIYENAVTKRKATSGAVDVPVEITIKGIQGELMGHQKAAVAYARQTISKGRGLIIADEPGLGKTCESLAIVEDQNAYPVLIICPAKLKLNWKNEIERWLPNRSVIVISAGKKSKKENDESLITPAEYMELCPMSDFVVVNYDIVRDVEINPHSTSNFDKYIVPEGTLSHTLINAFNPTSVIFDEGHVISNYKSAQTRTAKKIAARRKVRLLLTGTPVVNKPQDLLSQLTAIGQLEALGGFNFFREKYCGVTDFNPKGSPSNLIELHDRLTETCYIRRTKKDVLKFLPEKMYAEVVFANDNKKGYTIALANLLDGGDHKQMSSGMTEVDAMKEQAALGKMDGVVEWAEKNFIDSNTKLVIFAWHKSIQKELFTRLSAITSCARLSADDSDAQVEAYKEKFNNDPNCLIMIASMKMGSVGHTIHANGLATNVAFMEFGWNPKDHIQSEDRIHRIGQTGQVTVWNLIADGTVDRDILELIAVKRKIVNQIADGKISSDQSEDLNIYHELMQRIGQMR